MVSDEFTRRPPPPGPYCHSGRVLHLDPEVVVSTKLLLVRAGKRESCVFWFGLRHDDERAEVKAIIAPKQIMRDFNYSVPSSAMSEMANIAAPVGWKPLAQIHSHPGMGVEHSRYDDEMVSSRRVLSIVFPIYGRASGAWPSGLGVHEFQSEYWHLLPRDEVQRRVALRAGIQFEVLDLRS